MNLTTKYMGLELRNPLIASAGPLSETVDGIKKLETAGVGAVVMFSLFEEQLQQEANTLDASLEAGTESFAESLSYFPHADDFKVGPEQYLEILHAASQQVQIPIIGSLNGISSKGWIEYARKMQEAGAKGIELNLYYIPTDPKMSATAVEKQKVAVVQAVKAAVTIPVAVKLSPFFTSMASMARKMKRAGADALVLFNRFYQPDFDLDELTVSPTLHLSTAEEIRLPLRWLAILRGQLRISLAATTGVQTSTEVVKYLLAGADAVMTTSALLHNGPGYATQLIAGLQQWMEEHEYRSIKQMKGAMSQKSVADPTAFERANYIKILEKYKSEYTLKP
ncbi:MAG: dihydroorotate dehydrogenase-like protein [Verrucomicrobia bacterium]|nr:MAG: dihydroorotate dehydrogenase-like protein [Verrucomicrobiota bacterium]